LDAILKPTEQLGRFVGGQTRIIEADDPAGPVEGLPAVPGGRAERFADHIERQRRRDIRDGIGGTPTDLADELVADIPNAVSSLPVIPGLARWSRPRGG
jgi:hypothetical protein